MPSAVDRANAIRMLTLDAVEQAASGHIGAPMGMADIAEVLWREVLKHNPSNPTWWDRDRFVLSNGHGSMLLYALLHLTGYDVSMADIRNFRQLHSPTPGHPEYGDTPGVETTTGPLGQGIANAVGMALAERLLGARFNRPEHSIIDHRTWAFVGDGCLMEGISHEAASLAGTLGLDKLTLVYDDNGISIDGPVAGWFADDTAARFEAYGWHVIRDVDGHDPAAIAAALAAVVSDGQRPSLVCCKTEIGRGLPTQAGTAKAHGGPAGAEEVAGARLALGWPHQPFDIPADIKAGWDQVDRGGAANDRWDQQLNAYRQQFPSDAEELARCMQGDTPTALDDVFAGLLSDGLAQRDPLETRKASGMCLAKLGPAMPELVGGSADLSGSNNTLWPGATLVADREAGNYIEFGVREFAMTAIANGMSLHGGVVPYTGTFLTFLDYARNAVRLAALMGVRQVLVYTHDSLAVGEDGPTHQPVEHLTSLRTTPNLHTWRPCDLAETVVAWRAALTRSDGPSALVLSRQKIAPVARADRTGADIARGAYIVAEEGGANPDLILIATGSEVPLAVGAAKELAATGQRVRVVSMPCHNAFAAQDQVYRDSILPGSCRARVAIEAAQPDWWHRWVGLDGLVIGVDRFGVSAPGAEAMAAYGFTQEQVVAKVRTWLANT